MGVFSGYLIALELSSSLPLKRKKELRQLITSNDGTISFIITKKCKFLATGSSNAAEDSYKCRTAVEYGIPVVSVDYLYNCVNNGQLVDPDPFLVLGSTRSQLLNSGVIAASRSKSNVASKPKIVKYNLNSVKVWTSTDSNVPYFPDEYELAKSMALMKARKMWFMVVEIHVATSVEDPLLVNRFRIATHSMDGSKLDVGVSASRIEYRFSNSSDETLAVYAKLCQTQMDAPNGFIKTNAYLGKDIGSKKYQQRQLEKQSLTMRPAVEVEHLTELIWKEATGELYQLLAIPITQIKVDQVEKAESDLLEIRRVLCGQQDEKSAERLRELTNEFYEQLPHQPQYKLPIDTKRAISNKQQLCQLVLDMVSVSEATGWSRRCPAVSKYAALRCHISHLVRDDKDYATVADLVVSSQLGEKQIKIHKIYEIHRAIEDSNFTSMVDNKRLLFHASQPQNFVGILSRGLLLPKIVVDDLGGSRTDAGMLGSAIYFTDAASTSAQYSAASKNKGTRFMLICEVELGNSLDVYAYDTELTAPPRGFHSVHGVRRQQGIDSQFKDDEFAIYDLTQQRMRYLVEFSLPSDDVKVEEIDASACDESNELSQDLDLSLGTIELEDVQNIVDPLQAVKAGLVSDSDAPVPLKSVHIRARLIDLAAQVVVMQTYTNENNAAIEAKYVFPLDDQAAVCGFEAFINGKHVVGEVKEKEEAHREYREAVSRGHGAYLMDQDKETTDVFTVSVGNLPPHCSVLIKITYVAELETEGEKIVFRVPASVAPWKKSAALDTTTQNKVDTVRVTEESIDTSVHIAIEMPFDIKAVDSPSHIIRIKKTATKAVVEMTKNQSLSDGFLLLVSLAEIHVPRMWVEQHPDTDSRACMLAFYPEFETNAAESFDVIFLFDLSNSMKGPALLDAKKTLLLALNHLPTTCSFNVIIFGTDYDELFPSSRPKSKENENLAAKFIKNAQAVMGNTEVYLPLHSYFLLSPQDSYRNILLVSDGHLANEDTLLRAVQANCRNTRLFTFGVGPVANRLALRTLARVGGGAFEYFDPKIKSKWEGKVKSQLQKISQPGVSSISVEWQNFNERNEVVQAPALIMGLFNGCRHVIYGFVPNCTQATLNAVIDGQPVSTMVSTHELGVTKGKILHQLTAKAAIKDWQDGMLAASRIEHEILKKTRKNYIIKLSCDFSIITPFTSFVGVEKREEGEKMNAENEEQIQELIGKESVDILPYIGWTKLENEKKTVLDCEKLWQKAKMNISSYLFRLRDLVEAPGSEVTKAGMATVALKEAREQLQCAPSERENSSLSSYIEVLEHFEELQSFIKRDDAIMYGGLSVFDSDAAVRGYTDLSQLMDLSDDVEVYSKMDFKGAFDMDSFEEIYECSLPCEDSESDYCVVNAKPISSTSLLLARTELISLPADVQPYLIMSCNEPEVSRERMKFRNVLGKSLGRDSTDFVVASGKRSQHMDWEGMDMDKRQGRKMRQMPMKKLKKKKMGISKKTISEVNEQMGFDIVKPLQVGDKDGEKSGDREMGRDREESRDRERSRDRDRGDEAVAYKGICDFDGADRISGWIDSEVRLAPGRGRVGCVRDDSSEWWCAPDIMQEATDKSLAPAAPAESSQTSMALTGQPSEAYREGTGRGIQGMGLGVGGAMRHRKVLSDDARLQSEEMSVESTMAEVNDAERTTVCSSLSSIPDISFLRGVRYQMHQLPAMHSLRSEAPELVGRMSADGEMEMRYHGVEAKEQSFSLDSTVQRAYVSLSSDPATSQAAWSAPLPAEASFNSASLQPTSDTFGEGSRKYLSQRFGAQAAGGTLDFAPPQFHSFGASAPAGLFGSSLPQEQSFSGPTQGGLFGSAPLPSQGFGGLAPGGLLASAPPQSQVYSGGAERVQRRAPASGSLFGSASRQSQGFCARAPAPRRLFDSAPSQSLSFGGLTQGGLFDSAPLPSQSFIAPASGGLFGAAPLPSQGFGSLEPGGLLASAPPQSQVYSGGAERVQRGAPASGSLFGSAPRQSQGFDAPAPGRLFGSAPSQSLSFGGPTQGGQFDSAPTQSLELGTVISESHLFEAPLESMALSSAGDAGVVVGPPPLFSAARGGVARSLAALRPMPQFSFAGGSARGALPPSEAQHQTSGSALQAGTALGEMQPAFRSKGYSFGAKISPAAEPADSELVLAGQPPSVVHCASHALAHFAPMSVSRPPSGPFHSVCELAAFGSRSVPRSSSHVGIEPPMQESDSLDTEGTEPTSASASGMERRARHAAAPCESAMKAAPELQATWKLHSNYNARQQLLQQKKEKLTALKSQRLGLSCDSIKDLAVQKQTEEVSSGLFLELPDSSRQSNSAQNLHLLQSLGSLERSAAEKQKFFHDGIPQLSKEVLDALFDLQQTADGGYWKLDSELGELLQSNKGACFDILDVLMKAGLKSLGMRAVDDVPRLVATLLVLICLIDREARIEFLQPFQPSDEQQSSRAAPSLSIEQLLQCQDNDIVAAQGHSHGLELAKTYVLCGINKYPLVCSTLGLGRSWMHFAAKLMVYRGKRNE